MELEHPLSSWRDDLRAVYPEGVRAKTWTPFLRASTILTIPAIPAATAPIIGAVAVFLAPPPLPPPRASAAQPDRAGSPGFGACTERAGAVSFLFPRNRPAGLGYLFRSMPDSVTSLIPHRPPFLFVDEILAATPESLTARRTWRADEDFYKGHYPGAPITPGVLLCEAVFQTGALHLARQARAAGAKPGDGVPLLAKVSDVRFRNPVYPGDTIHIEVRQKESLGGFTMMGGAIKKPDGTRVLTVDFSVAWKQPKNAKP
ncbi:MAG: beta-hydroxyacyl-ACP dehydratase [Opitutaceae bacterium]|nr:beta-hydroxyacyl-ACP dehydratase [Opitutaceae bacterium]